ncbi:protein of unknown function DUF683 [Gluconacetobacter diazotrophicus PA1 5]|uniref:Uncharacterized protein n=2 Tax=Gluconacetobacter diazotrophicus TaxID=33996 RepID=A9H5Y0_GLUDA|nr:CCE_0567 family metalloprotein [Gluconacetobacter diazotrophicus]AAG27069.1 unknown [Gluconacetobacter diazotrophicus PA1 5]ACI51342.1 protein of unknown function DUF683 [Gluconacetobacter diazotrophicus PA1 5]MBB2157413.1 hypothetical protein [Gluconacetobacter diazotrophicus]TWB09890.1 hypothetical protein FBZ86_103172 [Gluconacetobacter diazotrophicus]CAP54386.1 conserved hypothetical protein [Gluconacetobacter diazotrophicus PA1 5]
MTDIAELKAELKKLSARATKAKMDLHDLSEDLPVNWQAIPDIAAQAHRAFAELTEKRAALAAIEDATKE